MKVWLCWLFGGHVWGFQAYMNGKTHDIECTKCKLNWQKKHFTDWRWE